jgi:signal transduction histidine kinase
MRLNGIISETTTKLREKAEAILKKSKNKTGIYHSESDALKLVHELELHQIELEMQNEELRQTRSEAMNSAEKYIELYNFAPAGYVTLTKDGQIIEINQFGSQMLGNEPSKLKNSYFYSYVSDETKEVYKDFLKRIFKTRKKESCELSLSGIQSSEIYTHLTGEITKNGSQCMVNIIDISNRRLAEKELELKNEELIKLNAEKDKFFSIIAHDLRGPFSTFLGITKILSEKLKKMRPEELREIVDSLRKSANSVYLLIENLLEWASLQRGLVQIYPEQVKLLDVVNRTKEIHYEMAKQKNLEIRVTVPGNLKVMADREMLNSIIRNLISNAIKFSEKGSVIYISAIIIQNNLVEVAVEDKGIGMNRELHKKLFHLNGQTSRKGTQGEPSAGLGLLICKDFIEKNGGQLNAESIEGCGSTFSFTLPHVP